MSLKFSLTRLAPVSEQKIIRCYQYEESRLKKAMSCLCNKANLEMTTSVSYDSSGDPLEQSIFVKIECHRCKKKIDKVGVPLLG